MAWYENLVIEDYEDKQEVEELLASYELLWKQQRKEGKQSA